MDVKKVIKEHGFTLTQVSELTGIHVKTLPAMVSSKRNVTVNTLRKIANAIGCNIADFFADEVKESRGNADGSNSDEPTPTITCPHCGKHVKVCVTIDK
jgi:transcriptional regulator with XRE-family HTH domain